MNTRSNTFVPALLGLLLSGVLAASCGVTSPDDSPWQNAGSFGWPTTLGVTMKYQSMQKGGGFDGADTTFSRTLTVGLDPSNANSTDPMGRDIYFLDDRQAPPTSQVHFLPLPDSLIVNQDGIGASAALTTPIEKGHRWVAAYYADKTVKWMAEIIELFAYRNVEGKTYKDVVAVRYYHPDGWQPPSGERHEEWIRFYAKGVGEILTVNNVIPESNLPNPNPIQQELRVLLETSAAVN